MDYARIRQRRVGSLSVLAPRRQKNETPTEKKKTHPYESLLWGPSDPPPPPLKGKEGGATGSPDN